MRRSSMCRQAIIALTAYLAFGVTMATHLPVPPAPTQVPRTDREAVLFMAHDFTAFLGAEALARKIMMLPAILDAASSLDTASLRKLFCTLVRG